MCMGFDGLGGLLIGRVGDDPRIGDLFFSSANLATG